MPTYIMLFLLLFSAGYKAYGHGEDKPGPNGGFIRMPGEFHTELVPAGSNSYKVFLLDLTFRNPSTVGSKVNLTVLSPGEKKVYPCEPTEEHFACETDGIKLGDGVTLQVEANRFGKKGVASYQLPLVSDGKHR